MADVLVIDDEECIQFTFKRFLAAERNQVHCASSYDAAIRHVSASDVDLVFADIMLEGRSGIEFLRECRKMGRTFPVVMITGYPDIGTATEAVRLGAFDYLTKPVEKEALLRVAELALAHRKAEDDREAYRMRLEAIFRSVEEAIVTVDDRFVVSDVNEGAKRFCCLGKDCVGKDIRTLTTPCTRKCLAPLEDAVTRQKSIKAYRIECKRDGDSPQIVSVSAFPLIDRPGHHSGAVMVLHNETHLPRRERNLGDGRHVNNLLGQSRAMRNTHEMIRELADLDSTVLITGESGTGKELVAEALHYLGNRCTRPFVKVNCSALPESLLESELFGHVKGAFTGAAADRIGRFQRASGGTIFLDEIGDISPRMQSGLLRVLQNKEFERVGDCTPIKVNVRILAATNKNLRDKVASGEFREDLLYRLNVVELHVPPLRNRREDIDPLVKHFLKNLNQRMRKQIIGISTDVSLVFQQYDWPGNIRELEHALEHAFVLCKQDVILTGHLPMHLQEAAGTLLRNGSVSGTRHGLKPESIIQALEKTAGNKKRAAQLLGIDRKTLYRNLSKHKIVNPTKFR